METKIRIPHNPRGEKSDMYHCANTRLLTRIITFLGENPFSTQYAIGSGIGSRPKLRDGLRWLENHKIIFSVRKKGGGGQKLYVLRDKSGNA